MDNNALCYLSARGLAELIHRREVSVVEAVEAYLERIEELNPVVGAVVSADPTRARAAARAADRALAAGESVGPLHGVPMTLKDGHDVAGLRTTIGTELFDRVPERDGTVAARLRAAGALIVGHSNVPPFLTDYRTDNAIFGRTNNPWRLDRTPGGSSGGAAAGLATGLTPIEVGSDLAGSIRLPSHFCGVYGLRASEHRVPATGFFRPLPGTPPSVRILNSLGPMARDLDDLELVLRIIAGPDGRDADTPPVPLGERTRRGLSDLRIAVATQMPGVGIAASLCSEVERVAEGASRAGARVAWRLPAIDSSQLRLFGDLVRVLVSIFDPGAELTEEQRSLAWYLATLEQRDSFIEMWERFFHEHDVLLLPPAVSTAFAHDASPQHEQGIPLLLASTAGLPALVVPAGQDSDGLPVGIQLVGPRWSELSLLDVACALEEAEILPGFTLPPAR